MLKIYSYQMTLPQSNLLSPDDEQLGQKRLRGMGDDTQCSEQNTRSIYPHIHSGYREQLLTKRLDSRRQIRVFIRAESIKESSFPGVFILKTYINRNLFV